MATMAMAQAVLQHAETYYNVGGWYVIAECWDSWAILEELDRQEELNARSFELDESAIGYFAGLILEPGGR